MFVPRIIQKLHTETSNVLLLGCGGGCDIFAGVPLYLELTSVQPPKTVVLANFSFTRDLVEKCPNNPCPGCCYEVRFADFLAKGQSTAFDEHLGFPANYFPEFHLSKFFFQQYNQRDVPVYAIPARADRENDPNTQAPRISELSAAYQYLIERYAIDTVILVDGGVDSVAKGDEEAMGTFVEEFMTFLALKNILYEEPGSESEWSDESLDGQQDDVNMALKPKTTSSVRNRWLMCVGLSTERGTAADGVSEYDFFQNLAELQRAGAVLGTVPWDLSMPSVQGYLQAVLACIPRNSSVQVQIATALLGHYGPEVPDHLRPRDWDDFWINPLMALSWFFDFDHILTRHNLFLTHEASEADSLQEVSTKIEVARLNRRITRPDGSYRGQRRFRLLF